MAESGHAGDGVAIPMEGPPACSMLVSHTPHADFYALHEKRMQSKNNNQTAHTGGVTHSQRSELTQTHSHVHRPPVPRVRVRSRAHTGHSVEQRRPPRPTALERSSAVSLPHIQHSHSPARYSAAAHLPFTRLSCKYASTPISRILWTRRREWRVQLQSSASSTDWIIGCIGSA